MRKLTDHIFFIQDTCSIYGVTVNDKTLLIDCGTVPAKLETNGVQGVDQVLLTHFHRDTCSAAAHWKQGGAEIVLPFAEKRFFLRRRISSSRPTISMTTTPPTILALVLWKTLRRTGTLTTTRACRGRGFLSM